LTNVATLGWYAQLRREGQLRAAGADPGFDMIMDLDSFTADGPVSFAVRVHSQTGFVSGRDVGYIPVSPERCSFTLAPGAAAGEEYAEHLNSCLSDWIVENGVPQQFNMEVSISLVSGTDYLFAGNWTMKSDAACGNAGACPSDQPAWYYDVPNAPTKIFLCQNACDAVSAAGDGANLNVVAGCTDTIVVQ